MHYNGFVKVGKKIYGINLKVKMDQNFVVGGLWSIENGLVCFYNWNLFVILVLVLYKKKISG